MSFLATPLKALYYHKPMKWLVASEKQVATFSALHHILSPCLPFKAFEVVFKCLDALETLYTQYVQSINTYIVHTLFCRLETLKNSINKITLQKWQFFFIHLVFFFSFKKKAFESPFHSTFLL